MRNKKGFTLIELSVTLVIISILSAIGFISYNGAQIKVRDSKRASDLKSIASALEMYRADYRKYPEYGSTEPAGCLTKECDHSTIPGNLSTWEKYETNWANFKTAMLIYMPTMPQDPRLGQVKDPSDPASQLIPFSYFYQAGDYHTGRGCAAGVCYTLFARPTEASAESSECKIQTVVGTEDWGGSYICLQN